MIKEEQLAAYKEMAKNASANGMEAQIRANLESTCAKFAGNEDKFERCISYLEESAQEILEGKNGDVPDEVCFRICRDYFNDEIWKAEDEENERKKAEQSKKKAEKAVKKTAAQVEKETVAKERECIENIKGKHSAKAETKFQVCPECGEECLYLYKGLCITCYHKKREAEEAKMEKIVSERETIADRNRLIIEENNKKLGIGLAETIDLFGTGK